MPRVFVMKKDKRLVEILGIFSMALGVCFYKFYFCILTAENAQGTANDFRNHINTAMEFLKYTQYGSKAIDMFKENCVYSHVIAYPMWHIVVMVLSRVLEPFAVLKNEESLITYTISITNSLLLVFSFLIIAKYLMNISHSVMSIIASVCLMFCGPLDNFGLFDTYYLGAFTPNIWHNPTYLAVKPCAIACYFTYIKVLKSKEVSIKEYIGASALLTLSALCKPSFYQCFVPALFFYCMVKWIVSRTKEVFFQYLKIAFTCMPVALIAFAQSSLAISGLGGAGVSYGPFYVIKHYTDNWVLCILLSLLFPLLVFSLCLIKNRWNAELELSGWLIFIAIATYILFYIEINPFAADFSWAIGLALNIVFVVATGEILRWSKNVGSDRIMAGICLVFLLAHTFFGTIYFMNMWHYGVYMEKLVYTLNYDFGY